jgi:hypothetical protein
LHLQNAVIGHIPAKAAIHGRSMNSAPCSFVFFSSSNVTEPRTGNDLFIMSDTTCLLFSTIVSNYSTKPLAQAIGLSPGYKKFKK